MCLFTGNYYILKIISLIFFAGPRGGGGGGGYYGGGGGGGSSYAPRNNRRNQGWVDYDQNRQQNERTKSTKVTYDVNKIFILFARNIS